MNTLVCELGGDPNHTWPKFLYYTKLHLSLDYLSTYFASAIKYLMNEPACTTFLDLFFPCCHVNYTECFTH